ncbi:hypothetical protein CRYUN_Cryun40dG0041200 [Craigia yunnanensis]
MMHTKKHLTGIKGLSEAKVDKIYEVAEKIVNVGYITGSDALPRLLANMRDGNGKVAYIDTERTLYPFCYFNFFKLSIIVSLV